MDAARLPAPIVWEYGLAEHLKLVESLSVREVEVLNLVAEGMDSKEVAAVLGISYRTVRTHVTSILTKLGARNRTQALRIALQAGIIAPYEPATAKDAARLAAHFSALALTLLEREAA